MVEIEVGKHYTACPLFADVHEERCKVAKKTEIDRPLHLRIAPARYTGICQRYPGIIPTG